MSEIFLLLLRILFPLDKLARSREFMRGWIKLVMSWVEDPEDVEGFAYWSDDRAKLEGHIAALEYGMQILILERARDLLGLPFLFIPRQNNPHIRHPKSMTQLFKRLHQLARDFNNLDKLASRRAERMKCEAEQNPLRLDAPHQFTSPTLRVVGANRRPLAILGAEQVDGLARRSAEKAAGGCASSRGCVRTRGPPEHPIFLESVTLAPEAQLPRSHPHMRS